VKTRKAAKALAVAVIALVAAAPAAGAHVTVQPGTAAQGSYMKVDVRVPNERDDAGTTSVEFNLPEDVAIRSVRVEAVPGWEYEIEKRTLDEPIEAGEGDPVTEVVSKITWSGGVIKPGEFQDFPVSLGPLPEDVDSLVFPAIQTYEGGEVVRWIDVAEEGAEEPERPAPTLTLTPAEEEGGATATTVADEAAAAPADDSDSSNGLAIAALVVGLLGLVVGGVALAKSRSTATAGASKD
jgi:periplasmic copper chaperone A